MYGHKRVYFVVGINKIEPDYDRPCGGRETWPPRRTPSAWAENPCAVKGDRCYDCKSPERICRGLSVIWGRPTPVEVMEVVLIGEDWE